MKTASITITQSPYVIAGRIEGFDLLRGLCAIAVAFYHIFAWRNEVHFNGVGRYGVYIFFVLSGASMYVAYNAKFTQGYDAGKFILLRVLRLAPLLALAIALTIANLFFKKQPVVNPLADSFLNLSFTFGLGNPGKTSVVTGGWSLGIEFVFYLIFPVMLTATRSRASSILLMLAFVAQHVFVNRTLAGTSLTQAWSSYTQPLSFIFYFMAGCCIGRLAESGNLRCSPLWIAGFIMSALPILSIHGEDNLVGLYGLLLSLAAAAIVLCSVGLPVSGFLSRISDSLGKLSYGVYLLHPLMFGTVNRLLAKQPTIVIAAATIALSSVIALILERYYEAPVRNHIRKVLGV